MSIAAADLPHPRRRLGDFRACGRGAFTLLEVTLAVAILAMMSLAIYRFVQANVVAMRVSSMVESEDTSYDGFRELLTQHLQSLPAGIGALTGDAFRSNAKDRDELTWICSAGPGLLTRYASGQYRVSLSLRPADKKSDRLDLGLLRRPQGGANLTKSNESWIRLIPNITTLQIRYFDSRLNAWVQRWPDAGTLPRMVKVTLTAAAEKVPRQFIVPLARTPL